MWPGSGGVTDLIRIVPAVVAWILLAPGPASAQGTVYATMEVSVAQVFDGNLFAAPASRGPQADLISRMGPAFDVGYRSIPLEFAFRYAMDAERYTRHAELNRTVARQEAQVGLRYRPNERVGLSANASYLATQTPGELNLESLLAVGRARADRASMRAGVTYARSPVGTIALAYAFARDALAGGIRTATSDVQMGLERRTGTRSAYRLRYSFRRLVFGEAAGSNVGATIHVISGAWIRAITPRTSLEIELGPQVAERSIRPELSATLRRRLRHGELSAGYSRTLITAIGEQGIVDVERVSLAGAYRLARGFTVTGAPVLARSTRDEARVAIYALDLGATVELTRRLSLVASGRIGHQEGTLGDSREKIPFRTFALQLTLAVPSSAAAGRRGAHTHLLQRN